MADKYVNWAALAAGEIEGIDYDRRWRQSRTSALCHLAIHGGGIEQGTTELADAAAGDVHSFWTLDASKTSNNSDLHITSTHMDEPRLVAMVEASDYVVSWHGAADTNNAATYVGGLDFVTRDRIALELTNAGFTVSIASTEIDGTDPNNIANAGTRGMGVQLELTTAQRQAFFLNGDLSRANRTDPANRTAAFTNYVNAVVAALNDLTVSGKG